MLTEAQWDLWGEVEYLQHLCQRRLPQSDPVRHLITQTLWMEDDDQQPDPAAMAVAREAFYAMPPAKLRKVMAGWRTIERRDTREHLNGCNEAASIHRVMELVAHGGSQLNDEPVTACHDFAFNTGFAPVRVVIAEGTTSGEALSALNQIRDLLDHEWETLISEPYYPVPQDTKPAVEQEAELLELCHA